MERCAHRRLAGYSRQLLAEQVDHATAVLCHVSGMCAAQIAGMEDEPEPAPAPKKASSISGNQWAQQLEKSYASSGGGGGGGGARRSVLLSVAKNCRFDKKRMEGKSSEHGPSCALWAPQYAKFVTTHRMEKSHFL